MGTGTDFRRWLPAILALGTVTFTVGSYVSLVIAMTERMSDLEDTIVRVTASAQACETAIARMEYVATHEDRIRQLETWRATVDAREVLRGKPNNRN